MRQRHTVLELVKPRLDRRTCSKCVWLGVKLPLHTSLTPGELIVELHASCTARDVHEWLLCSICTIFSAFASPSSARIFDAAPKLPVCIPAFA